MLLQSSRQAGTLQDNDRSDDYYPFPSIARARARGDWEVQYWNERTVEGFFDLFSSEKWWAGRYHFLLSRGYCLRKRFEPGWRPSWIGTDKNPYYCEDSLQHPNRSVLDARRQSDGTTVAIKRLRDGNHGEAQIALMFSTPERSQDPTNHCVPILDHFTDPSDGTKCIVMPLLRAFSSPPFHSVGEVLDFIRQTLQGLVYMHSQGVAHRNLTTSHIMMHGDALYPNGFHPSQQEYSPVVVRDMARHIHRSDAATPVKYYFIDFGLSTCFRDPRGPRLVKGCAGLDRSVPELSTFSPYDPFPADVYTLGNIYKTTFLNHYTNLGLLEPLVEAMTQRDSQRRPTALEALEHFELIVSRQLVSTRVSRLRKSGETFVGGLVQDIAQFTHVLQHLPGFTIRQV